MAKNGLKAIIFQKQMSKQVGHACGVTKQKAK
jgi:hypothetical protein